MDTASRSNKVDPHGPRPIITNPRNPMRVPADSHQTKMKTNRNWNARYQDGKHKPKEKK